MRLPPTSRRALSAALAPLIISLGPPIERARAFDNGLPEVVDMIGRKQKGPPPEGLGVQKNGGLRPCLDGKPHCFSSTFTVGESAVDTSKIGRDWIVQPFTYTGMTVLGALSDLQKAIDAYVPGQNGIDEGGFKLRTVRLPNAPEDPAYLYVQFEARQGYIDVRQPASIPPSDRCDLLFLAC
jgi:hypothetical protein